jgi:hypothetical protein
MVAIVKTQQVAPIYVKCASTLFFRFHFAEELPQRLHKWFIVGDEPGVPGDDVDQTLSAAGVVPFCRGVL